MITLLLTVYRLQKAMDRIYLSEAKLKGYRTIKDLSVKFNPGLNIIIGKNGSGKTNFIIFLFDTMMRYYDKYIDSKTSLSYLGKKEFIISSKNNVNLNNKDTIDIKEIINTDLSIFYQNEKHTFTTSSEHDKFINDFELTTMPILIPHGLRMDTFNRIISSPFSINIRFGGLKEIIEEATNTANSTYFRSLLTGLIIKLIPLMASKKQFDDAADEISNIVLSLLNSNCDFLNENLTGYIPVEKVRLGNSLNCFKDSDNNIKIENVYLEYYVKGNWIPFSSLSDGTKRMFCIFSDVIMPNIFDVPDITINLWSKIVLLEEPELGIHPHQFEQIMTFLKKMSKDVQIILTTHSPQALDILSKDELDALHICEYHPETGTTLISLSEGQIDKAKAYMDSEMYLSDYWRYSDLEK
jgi:AAA15 family ATPase/GTPase